MPLHRWLIALGINDIGETTAREISRFHNTFNDIRNASWLTDILRLQELYSERIKLNPNGHENKNRSLNEKESLKLLFEKNYDNCWELMQQLSSRGIIETNPPKKVRDFSKKLILDNYYSYSTRIGPIAAKNVTSFLQSEQGIETLHRMENLSICPKSDNYYDPKDDSIKSLPFTDKICVITGTLSKPRPDFKKLIEINGGKVSSSISKNTDYLLCGEKGGSKRDKAINLDVPILNEEEFISMITNENL